MELSSSKIKKFLISGGNSKTLKIKKNLYFFPHFFFIERKLFKHKCKRKTFLIFSLIKKQNLLN